MIDLPSYPPAVHSAVLVGVVLSEAVSLYVGYDVLARIVSPLMDRIQRN